MTNGEYDRFDIAKNNKSKRDNKRYHDNCSSGIITEKNKKGKSASNYYGGGISPLTLQACCVDPESPEYVRGEPLCSKTLNYPHLFILHPHRLYMLQYGNHLLGYNSRSLPSLSQLNISTY